MGPLIICVATAIIGVTTVWWARHVGFMKFSSKLTPVLDEIEARNKELLAHNRRDSTSRTSVTTEGFHEKE